MADPKAPGKGTTWNQYYEYVNLVLSVIKATKFSTAVQVLNLVDLKFTKLRYVIYFKVCVW